MATRVDEEQEIRPAEDGDPAVPPSPQNPADYWYDDDKGKWRGLLKHCWRL